MKAMRTCLFRQTAIHELLDIFSHCMETAGEERLGKVFLLDEGSETPPVFAGCGIMGKGKRLALLLSKDFVKTFQERQLTKEEIKAIFFHEIAHIKNRDYFMPLWSKTFIQCLYPLCRVGMPGCFSVQDGK